MSGNSIERLLDKIDADISAFLIFAGVLDNNAKLLSFRRGKASFSLPIERHDTLDVQLSLMFSLIRQLEDISGPHKFTVTRFARHDIFLFGTADMHVFVITSPTSEGQVAKTLSELVATMSDSELPMAAPNLVGGGKKDQTMTAAATTTTMASVRHNNNNDGELNGIDRQQHKLSLATAAKPRPEAIAMLQGYLMALEADCIIQDDANGYYKVKAGESDRLTWSVLEKVSHTFKDRIEIHHVGLDTDGKVLVRISLK
ncbi:hypothetical protein [Candidatus Nitrososphaera gargensis]|uniref:hypothetical protein n=1 Tax=Candidatus Nitrososphaera gargensis TaxID=497727 RepID=UPI0011E587AE|nr:hypothetical protein [Candidatus Nitrososphaera gargensis]